MGGDGASKPAQHGGIIAAPAARRVNIGPAGTARLASARCPEAKFEDRPLETLIGTGGAYGTGYFGVLPREIFLTGAASFRYAGDEATGGRNLLRFEYRVPLEKSRFAVKIGAKGALVAYHGSFWVDRDSLDLVRLELYAEDIPRDLGITHDSDVLEYARVAIGGSDFLLPKTSVMRIIDKSGEESRNQTTFSNCRQYVGESTLTFGDPVAPAGGPAPEPEKTAGLAGISFEATLVQAVDARSVAIGDLIEAALSHPARKGSVTLMPKGAVIRGRLTRLEKHTAVFGPFLLAGVEFFEIAADGRASPVRVELDQVGFPNDERYFVLFGRRSASGVWARIGPLNTASPRPHESLFLVRGTVLPARVSLLFRTVPEQ